MFVQVLCDVCGDVDVVIEYLIVEMSGDVSFSCLYESDFGFLVVISMFFQ